MYTLPFAANRSLYEPMMGAGILGFLVFLPCWIFASLRIKSRKHFLVFSFALLFTINLLSISASIAYMSYSVRFIMSFLLLSSPVLVYSYFSKVNPLKYIIIFFSLFYMIFVSTHLWARPLCKILRTMKYYPSITSIRNIAICKNFDEIRTIDHPICSLAKKIKKEYSPNNRMLIFLSSSEWTYILKSLEFEGYKVDFATMEDAFRIDFSKYNFVVIPNSEQTSTLIKDFETRKKYYEIVGNDIIIKKKSSVPCYYVQNARIPAESRTAPFQVKCIMSKSFLTMKNFKMASAAGYISSKEEDSKYYVIYENKALPINKKKKKN